MAFQFSLLEQSLIQIQSRQDDFARRFYETLFARHPELQPHFANTDMAKQQKMLIAALVLIVRSLEKPQLLSTTIKGLAERHRRYGAATEYFPHLGEALFATFAEFLGSDWTIEMKQSWVSAYETISQKMIDGMKQNAA